LLPKIIPERIGIGNHAFSKKYCKRPIIDEESYKRKIIRAKRANYKETERERSNPD
jgi:hypothetical protein